MGKEEKNIVILFLICLIGSSLFSAIWLVDYLVAKNISNNVSRMVIVGVNYGIIIIFAFIFQTIHKRNQTKEQSKLAEEVKNLKNKNWKIIVSLFLICFIGWVLLCVFWLGDYLNAKNVSNELDSALMMGVVIEISISFGFIFGIKNKKQFTEQQLSSIEVSRLFKLIKSAVKLLRHENEDQRIAGLNLLAEIRKSETKYADGSYPNTANTICSFIVNKSNKDYDSFVENYEIKKDVSIALDLLFNKKKPELTDSKLKLKELDKKNNYNYFNLSNAKLTRADLSNSDLISANLFNADFSGVDLSNSDLSGAILNSANLSDADLSNADFSGADLNNADLTKAKSFKIDNYSLGKIYYSGIDKIIKSDEIKAFYKYLVANKSDEVVLSEENYKEYLEYKKSL